MSFANANALARFSAEKLQKVNVFETEQMFCDVYCLEPGQAQKPHRHAGASKFYFVIEGEVRATIGGDTRTLSAGDIAYSLPDEEHGVENASDARATLLVAMAPNPN